METSFEGNPPPPPSAGVLIYPNSVSKRPASSHSGGSFGPVFAVLAVILVLSVAACVISRLFGKGSSNHGKKGRSKERDPEFEYGFGPRGPPGDARVEFGFERKNPQMVMGNGYGRPPHLPMMESSRRFG